MTTHWTEHLREHQKDQPGNGIWEFPTKCKLCGYIPKMGNRRTATSRANWLRYCMARHHTMHENKGESRE